MSILFLTPPPSLSLIRLSIISSENWVELLQAVFQCTKSPSNDHRESAYRIIATVPTLITEQDPSLVKAVFAAALADASPQVKGAAVKAAIYYLMNISEPRVRNGFVDMLLEIVNVREKHVCFKDQYQIIHNNNNLSRSSPPWLPPSLKTRKLYQTAFPI